MLPPNVDVSFIVWFEWVQGEVTSNIFHVLSDLARGSEVDTNYGLFYSFTIKWSFPWKQI